MFGRLRSCWMQVANHAATHNDSYQWIVRTRPDLFFVGALASTLKLSRQDAIYARGRRFGPRWDAIRGTKRNNKPKVSMEFTKRNELKSYLLIVPSNAPASKSKHARTENRLMYRLVGACCCRG